MLAIVWSETCLNLFDYLPQMLAFINKAVPYNNHASNTCSWSNKNHYKKQEQLNELNLY